MHEGRYVFAQLAPFLPLGKVNLAVDSCSERVENEGHSSRQFNPIARFGSMRLLAGGLRPRPRARKVTPARAALGSSPKDEIKDLGSKETPQTPELADSA